MSWSVGAADVPSTAFIAGDAYRFVHPFTITSGSPLVIRAIVSEPVILSSIVLDLVEGDLTIETMVGGTPTGVFGTIITAFNRNRLDGAPTPSSPVDISYGGAHTDGTLLDILHPKTDNNANRSSSVGDTQSDERGIAIGTYYFRLTSIAATSIGIVRGRFERPHFKYN